MLAGERIGGKSRMKGGAKGQVAVTYMGVKQVSWTEKVTSEQRLQGRI